MQTVGTYESAELNGGLVVCWEQTSVEIGVIVGGNIVSAYKQTSDNRQFCFGSTLAKAIHKKIAMGWRGCTQKNGAPAPFALGTVVRHSFTTRSGATFLVDKYNGVYLANLDLIDKKDNVRMHLEYTNQPKLIPDNINYIELTLEQEFKDNGNSGDDPASRVKVRSLAEISLEKDVTWLNGRRYYIVNDETQAEQLFTVLEKFPGIIAYDTETTGLKINMFGKINSERARELEEYNKEHPDAQIRADKLVGIIFCCEEKTSYYIPCANRKFKNLYSDISDPRTRAIAERIKAAYTVGELRDRQGDMANLIRQHPVEEFSADVILMERVRKILEKGNLTGHNIAFDWKVSWLYEIAPHFTDDTMILHQLMYKFRSTTSNRGEPSNLKYLTKTEFGIDQLELTDFFVGATENNDDTVRKVAGKSKKSKKGVYIDFSYMDYDGARAYGPADGDFSLGLFNRYKADLKKNHSELEYLYTVEVIVAQAIGYMEFYGHRIDETKIEETRLKYEKQKKEMIEQIKAMTGLDNADELNIGSPAQMAYLFYDIMGIPVEGEKRSVSKSALKPLLKMKNEDGSPKYPIIQLYSDYTKVNTLLTKFFDNLQNFMYPGGFIFSHYGQISTATGRMSCSSPNAQQYPKAITKIVVPRPGYILLDSDYSQIEYRVLTALAKESHLMEKFRDPDNDYHTLMASLMFGVDYASVSPDMRKVSKSFNFGIPYGMGLRSLCMLLYGMVDDAKLEDTKAKYELYFRDQPKVRQFFADVKEAALINRYTQTYFGRRRYYSFTGKDGKEDNRRKGAALRQAGNACIQGCLGPDVRIQTKECGIVKVSDVVGQRLHVWDGTNWTLGDITYSGKKQKTVVTFGDGSEFICSPIHKFLVATHKGFTHFVEAKDLKCSEYSNNPNRVVISRKYEASDSKYKTEDKCVLAGCGNGAKNVFIEDMGDSFKAGVALGRLASDGSIFCRESAGSLRWLVAEHERDILPELLDALNGLGAKYVKNEVRENRNEALDWINVYCRSLTEEVAKLDIKHRIPEEMWKDTEMLRGFLRGMFDGDGGMMGDTIGLSFGNQYDFTEMCRDIQRALRMFGIRSRVCVHKYGFRVYIQRVDNQKFAQRIGFMNHDKQARAMEAKSVLGDNCFKNAVTTVKSVEVTDEWIDMYDVCNTAGGYYMADGFITHNTAADIYKISVARMFTWIKQNNLMGQVLIVNMIHDEQLLEVNCDTMNVQAVLANVLRNMEFSIEGFPPLTVGGGTGMNWADAKGKMAEVHPVLGEMFCKEAEGMSLWADHPTPPEEWVDYFRNRNYEFRRKKVLDYICDQANWGQPLAPVIGQLLNLQFVPQSVKDNLKANPEYYKGKDAQQLSETLEAFVKDNNLDIDPRVFSDKPLDQEDEEEDEGYEDGDDEDAENEDGEYVHDGDFALIDEDESLYGVSLQELIKTFGLIVSRERKVCGVDIGAVPKSKRDELYDYLEKHACEDEDDGAMRVCFLKSGNILVKTDVFVKGISGSEMTTRLGINSVAYR